jgi:hypothetical protein
MAGMGQSDRGQSGVRPHPQLFTLRQRPGAGFKWAAKLRATKTDGNLLLLKINMGAGHGGKSGRWDKLHEIAETYTFILTQVR